RDSATLLTLVGPGVDGSTPRTHPFPARPVTDPGEGAEMDKRDARGRPRRTALVLPVAVVLALAACGGGAPPAPPAPPEDVVVRQGIERILELSDVDGLLAGRARAFTRQVAIMLLDPTDEELERLVPAVLDAFDHEALKEDVATRMAVDADPSVVSSVLEWMEAGSTAAVRRIADG